MLRTVMPDLRASSSIVSSACAEPFSAVFAPDLATGERYTDHRDAK
jgi:hypothetical protein